VSDTEGIQKPSVVYSVAQYEVPNQRLGDYTGTATKHMLLSASYRG